MEEALVLPPVGGAAGGNGRDLEARGRKARPRRIEEFRHIRAPAVFRKGHEPAKDEARRTLDRLGKADGGLRRLDAVAGGARVTFDHHLKIAPGEACGMGEAFEHRLIVSHHLDGGAPGELRQALQLVLANDVEGQQHVGDAAIGHDLRLAQLLDGDSRGAQVKLGLGQRHQLVGLDVRSVGKAQRIAALLPAPQVARHDIDVDDGNGGFEVFQAPAHVLELEMLQNVHAGPAPSFLFGAKRLF